MLPTGVNQAGNRALEPTGILKQLDALSDRSLLDQAGHLGHEPPCFDDGSAAILTRGPALRPT
jgi:hypothetical protein